jgi:hypothetical protein
LTLEISEGGDRELATAFQSALADESGSRNSAGSFHLESLVASDYGTLKVLAGLFPDLVRVLKLPSCQLCLVVLVWVAYTT